MAICPQTQEYRERHACLIIFISHTFGSNITITTALIVINNYIIIIIGHVHTNNRIESSQQTDVFWITTMINIFLLAYAYIYGHILFSIHQRRLTAPQSFCVCELFFPHEFLCFKNSIMSIYLHSTTESSVWPRTAQIVHLHIRMEKHLCQCERPNK